MLEVLALGRDGNVCGVLVMLSQVQFGMTMQNVESLIVMKLVMYYLKMVTIPYLNLLKDSLHSLA
jgi:hypothetical protein